MYSQRLVHTLKFCTEFMEIYRGRDVYFEIYRRSILDILEKKLKHIFLKSIFFEAQ